MANRLGRPLAAEELYGLQQIFLMESFDSPAPTPAFHFTVWDDYTSMEEFVAAAAPRGHAKSTGLTFTYTMGELLFRNEDYVIVISNTEKLAKRHLANISAAFRDNERLRQTFGVKELSTDNKLELEVTFTDGHACCVQCYSSGQSPRGTLWRNKRPGLIVCDDLEDNETVDSDDPDMLASFKEWFYRVLIPVRRSRGRVRVHGTILGEQSLLADLMKDASWKHHFYKAHRSYDDFSELLWPEMHSEESLRKIQKLFITGGDPFGYSVEYLNTPIDRTSQIFALENLLPLRGTLEGRTFVGCDFAVSTKTVADDTAFTVGMLGPDNVLRVIYVVHGRWSSDEWLAIMIDIQRRFNPEAFFVEDGVIWMAVKPMIMRMMQEAAVFMSLIALKSLTDKVTRSVPMQRRVRSHAMQFDHSGEWWPGYSAQVLSFRPKTKGRDDMVDSSTILCRGVESQEQFIEIETRVVSEDPHDDPTLQLFAKHWTPEVQGSEMTAGY